MIVRRGLAAMIVVMAGCGASSAHTAHIAAARCGPASARTLAADGTARIYDRSGTVYGCSTGNGRAFRLGSSSASLREGRVGPVALAGADAAYGVASHGVDTGTAQVVVRRLTDGKVLHTAAATARVAGPESAQSVGSLVVKADGAVAWIGVAHSIVGRAQEIEVRRLDRRGGAQLDTGKRIATRSLRLHKSQLTWLDSGRQRSATLS